MHCSFRKMYSLLVVSNSPLKWNKIFRKQYIHLCMTKNSHLSVSRKRKVCHKNRLCWRWHHTPSTWKSVKCTFQDLWTLYLHSQKVRFTKSSSLFWLRYPCFWERYFVIWVLTIEATSKVKVGLFTISCRADHNNSSIFQMRWFCITY